MSQEMPQDMLDPAPPQPRLNVLVAGHSRVLQTLDAIVESLCLSRDVWGSHHSLHFSMSLSSMSSDRFSLIQMLGIYFARLATPGG